MNGFDYLRSQVEKSAFHRSINYTVNARFHNFLTPGEGLLAYTDELDDFLTLSPKTVFETISLITPVFQRENTKWSVAMQQKFIENLLSGCRTEVTMYSISVPDKLESLGSCRLLDGLQRTTAIADFQAGKFSIFKNLYWSMINTQSKIKCKLFINIYEFESELEAVEFYIAMNDGITHSPDDMLSAYKYRDMLIEQNKQ